MGNPLDPEYQRFLKNQRQNIPEGTNPFGTDQSHQQDSGWLPWKPKRQVQGAANWSEIWTDEDDMGTDLFNPPQLNALRKPKALPDDQLEYLKQERPGELWRNIQFFKKLEEGSFGSVWDVVAERRTGSRWEAPTLLEHVVDSGRRPWMKWKKIRLACKVMNYPRSWAGHWHSIVNIMLADMFALRYLKHENIVQFHDIIGIPDSQTGFPYAFIVILMDLCDGDLFSLLEQQTPNCCFTDQQTMAWLRQIASALRYLHVDMRTVHLDIKPENILYVSRAGLPIDQWIYKLTDFGTAISYNNNKGDPMVSAVKAGTKDYNSDEMNANCKQPVPQPIDTTACDIYSLGATVANSIIGQLHYINGKLSPQELVNRMATNQPGSLSWKLINLTIQMLNADPQKRPTIEQLCDRLADM
ncbi:probable serine/threonine-protein kinase DDB_G0279405 [Oppia nitens]|uniref:probable serine/threonine-protein kinase DDB_G0279405 n=1 Tax=Oppia nitens TaxID=1686743 RepID=UPI0023D9FDA7|nr:probable serine/threonine-protein kinase DDB_G0279405 [Oppia nitens]